MHVSASGKPPTGPSTSQPAERLFLFLMSPKNWTRKPSVWYACTPTPHPPGLEDEGTFWNHCSSVHDVSLEMGLSMYLSVAV